MDGRALAPAYLAEPTNIMDDGVVRTLEKLTWQATGGKYIVGMWDSPLPAAVNPLAQSDFQGWDTKPMHVEFAPVGEEKRVRGRRKVSAIKGYRGSNSLAPFYGYKSEAPTSKAFKESDPVGPVASSIKAAGELAACAELHGESADKIWQLLEGSWGIDVSKIKDYVIPDISQSSEKDVIKFVRSTSHTLYGFNAESPRVTVSGGSYKPETMEMRAYVDWHRMYLSLRFVGSLAATYFPSLIIPGRRTLFAPAYIELPGHIDSYFAERLEIPAASTASNRMKALAKKTTMFYEGSMEAYGVAAYLRPTHLTDVAASEIFNSVDLVRSLGKKAEGVQCRVPAGVYDNRGRSNFGDVRAYDLKVGKKTAMVPISKLKMTFKVGWKTASAMAFEAFFRSRSNTRWEESIRSLLREGTGSVLMKSFAQDEWKRVFLENVPSDIGMIIFKLLLNGLPTEQEAHAEYYAMIKELAAGATVDVNGTTQEVFARAISVSRDIGVAISMAQRGLSRLNSYVHATKRFQFKHVPGREVGAVLVDSIQTYAKEKAKYWADHYGSRIEDTKKILADSSREFKRLPKKVRAEYRASGGIDKDSLSDLAKRAWPLYLTMLEAKTDSVLYGFLKQTYPLTEFDVDNMLRVEAKLSVGNLRKVLLKTVDSYIRKRRTWGKRLAAVCEREEEIVRELASRTRHTDMLNYLDRELQPRISFVWLYRQYQRKITPARNSIQKVLRASIIQVDDEQEIKELEAEWDEDATEQDAKAAREAVAVALPQAVARSGPNTIYDVLMESDTDLEDEEEERQGVVGTRGDKVDKLGEEEEEEELFEGEFDDISVEGDEEEEEDDEAMFAGLEGLESKAGMWKEENVVADKVDIRDWFSARYQVVLSNYRLSKIAEAILGDPNERMIPFDQTERIYPVYASIDVSEDVAPADNEFAEAAAAEYDIAK